MSTQVIPDFPVGYRIRRALEVADVKPEAVAARLGVGVTTVWNYVGGRTQPKRMALAVIADLTGVSLEWLEGTETNDSDNEGRTLKYHLPTFAAA